MPRILPGAIGLGLALSCTPAAADADLMAQLQAKAVTDDAMLAADIASHKTAPAAGAKVGIDPIATGAI